MLIERYFTKGIEGKVLESITYKTITSIKILNADKSVNFELQNGEFPLFWSDTACKIVASKYFKTSHGETSVKQLISRVCKFITNWGIKLKYFTEAQSEVFYDELCYLMVHQFACFNSPVWFNAGLHEAYGIKADSLGTWAIAEDLTRFEEVSNPTVRPLLSACFITKQEDTLMGIAKNLQREMKLFSFGSGTGSDFSVWRGKGEALSTGGSSSGALSFLSIMDKGAGSTKSGGKNRRAAKMVVFKADHPEIEGFINWKWREERKGAVLEKYQNEWKLPGIDDNLQVSGMDGEAVKSIDGQNSNNSFRASDAFMLAAEQNLPWDLKAVKTREVVKTVNARDLLMQVATAAWHTGDPGMQFDDACNIWNPVIEKERFNATNPCGEFNHLDDSACNLLSFNLMKFYDEKQQRFDFTGFKAAIFVCLVAMDIIVDAASYPTKEIALNSYHYRPLGMGYANLGALLQAMDLPYSYEEARLYTSVITAFMHGCATDMSMRMAEQLGPFTHWQECTNGVSKVYAKHADHLINLMNACSFTGLKSPNTDIKDALIYALTQFNYVKDGHPIRNDQLTLIAPTGTIMFMMDCDTGGCEPDYSIVKYKTLSGSGEVLKLVSETAAKILKRATPETGDALKWVLEHGTAKGCPFLSEDDQAVLAGANEISWVAHIDMMAAIQPFVSGSISKTINMPNDSTIQDIYDAYMYSWKRGLKAVALYRDGCKIAQPMARVEKKTEEKPAVVLDKANHVRTWGMAKKAPENVLSVRQKFKIGSEYKGYIHVGLYPDTAEIAEIFVKIAPYGGPLGGFIDAWATAISKGIQYGWPIEDIVSTFAYWKFEPSGFSGNEDIGYAASIIDYVARYLQHFDAMKSLILQNRIVEVARKLGVKTSTDTDGAPIIELAEPNKKATVELSFSSICPNCKSINNKGKCKPCDNCGYDPGCSGGSIG